MDEVRLTEAQAHRARGCWVDGSRGWYAMSLVVDAALARGMVLGEDDTAILVAYRAGDECLVLASGEEVDVVGSVVGQGELVDRALEWLNEHVAPVGWVFELEDGLMLRRITPLAGE